MRNRLVITSALGPADLTKIKHKINTCVVHPENMSHFATVWLVGKIKLEARGSMIP